jgi:hypothetical protein
LKLGDEFRVGIYLCESVIKCFFLGYF